MALILVELHGKRGESLSNQMRQTKAMWPEYSVRWWQEHDMHIPPVINPGDFMRKKIEWRYAKGVPGICAGTRVALGDNTLVGNKVLSNTGRPIKLLFTSPPYPGVTNYHIDQWIRLWLLGGETRPTSHVNKFHKGRFGDIQKYENLLRRVFVRTGTYLDESSTIVIRTDKRPSTRLLTVRILKELFPHKTVTEIEHNSAEYDTQTMLFGDSVPKEGEVDIILSPSPKRQTARMSLR